ncbi:MAG: hypothetical protein ACM3OC_02960 [Deltaproteobacteria bacterium]
MRPLIEKNRPLLAVYLACQCCLFFFISGKITPLAAGWAIFLISAAAAVGEAVDPDLKAIFVFWRVKNRFPGCRAYSIIVPRDGRIGFARLSTLFPDGRIPMDADGQRYSWYSFYKRYERTPSILRAHRIFLLARDAGLMSLALIPVLAFAGLLADSGVVTVVSYSVFLSCCAVLGSAVSRDQAYRIVVDVMLEALNEKDVGKDEAGFL